MSERHWADESVTLAEEGKARSLEEILSEPVHPEHPLEALSVQDRAFCRVVYGLAPQWEDVVYIAATTGTSPQQVEQDIRAIHQQNVHRLRDPAKLMEKVARAYSRLTELAEEEQALQEKSKALSYQRPVDEKQMNEVATKLQQIGERMAQLRALQGKWREERRKALRIPSKEVAQIFRISVTAVDKRVEHIRRRVRKLARKGETDGAATDR